MTDLQYAFHRGSMIIKWIGIKYLNNSICDAIKAKWFWIVHVTFSVFLLKLNSCSNASVFLSLFVMSWGVFIQTQTPPTASDKTLMQSVFRWPIESCVTSVKRSWSWIFFNSCSDIALEVAIFVSIYRLDAHDLKKWKCDKVIKKRLLSSMNSAVVVF